jgi:2-keto-4-pentenoate hydratase/2-oxohepta-3-ene-1,7-dioic acid hydratase in catechol pathway
MYPKILAPTVWPLAEVLPHWDAMILRSWVSVNGERRPYQEDTLQAMLTPADLLAEAARVYGVKALQRAIVFSGTIATLGGELQFGERFEIELLDPVLGRRIQHSYAVQLLG